MEIPALCAWLSPTRLLGRGKLWVLGSRQEPYPFLDLEHPVTVGSYMNEPDLINNRYQLHLAMEQAGQVLEELFLSFGELSGRNYAKVEGVGCEAGNTVLVLLGSSYDTSVEAVEELRNRGQKVGAATLHVLRPFPGKELMQLIGGAGQLVVADRQDSYGAGGGNLSLEVRAALQKQGNSMKVKSLVYGLGGKDFLPGDVEAMLRWAESPEKPEFAYYGVTPGKEKEDDKPLLAPVTARMTQIGAKGNLNAVTAMPARIAPGHGACPGCGIPVNLNLLLRGIEDPVVLLFQTGCAMIVTTAYPRTSFRVPYLHNLFQNGAATLSGVAEICYRKQQKGEIPPGDIVFVMVTGDGGMDIGMGSALGTALRGHRLLIFEYDNGGYMNTGYQYSWKNYLRCEADQSGRRNYSCQNG